MERHDGQLVPGTALEFGTPVAFLGGKDPLRRVGVWGACEVHDMSRVRWPGGKVNRSVVAQFSLILRPLRKGPAPRDAHVCPYTHRSARNGPSLSEAELNHYRLPGREGRGRRLRADKPWVIIMGEKGDTAYCPGRGGVPRDTKPLWRRPWKKAWNGTTSFLTAARNTN